MTLDGVTAKRGVERVSKHAVAEVSVRERKGRTGRGRDDLCNGQVVLRVRLAEVAELDEATNRQT